MDNDSLNQPTDRGFLYFWGIEGVEECVLEVGAIMVFRGGMRVVLVPAGAIAWVDTAFDAAIGVQSNLFFHILCSHSYSKKPNFLFLPKLPLGLKPKHLCLGYRLL